MQRPVGNINGAHETVTVIMSDALNNSSGPLSALSLQNRVFQVRAFPNFSSSVPPQVISPLYSIDSSSTSHIK